MEVVSTEDWENQFGEECYSKSNGSGSDEQPKRPHRGKGLSLALSALILITLVLVGYFALPHIYNPTARSTHESAVKVVQRCRPIKVVPRDDILDPLMKLSQEFSSKRYAVHFSYNADDPLLSHAIAYRLDAIYASDKNLTHKYAYKVFPPIDLPKNIPRTAPIIEVVTSPRGIIYAGPLTSPAVEYNTPASGLSEGYIILYTLRWEPYALEAQYLLRMSKTPVAIYPEKSAEYSLIISAAGLQPDRSYVIHLGQNEAKIYPASYLQDLSDNKTIHEHIVMYYVLGCKPCESAREIISQNFTGVKFIDIDNTTTPPVSFVPTLSVKVWTGSTYITRLIMGLKGIKKDGLYALYAFDECGLNSTTS